MSPLGVLVQDILLELGPSFKVKGQTSPLVDLVVESNSQHLYLLLFSMPEHFFLLSLNLGYF